MKVTVDGWAIELHVGDLPPTYLTYRHQAELSEEFDLSGEGTMVFFTASSSARDWPELVVAQKASPGPGGGFHPGVLIASDTGVIFLGAGTRILAYNLQQMRRLWVDEADAGFGSWKRHSGVIVMAAELELAAWTAQGEKLWTTFVEPPWSYEAVGDLVRLEVMGEVTEFDLRSGPQIRAAQQVVAADGPGGYGPGDRS